MRNAFFISFFLLISVFQTTAQCFEIESLLVDACGSPEGENEMLRFKVGPSPLDANDLYMVWASSNNWLGICQNTASANATAALNNTITSCGLLIEPAGGILPANSTVLLITSTAVDANANSFANLNDTMYVIYQCAGNTGGHFGNYSPTFLLRTVTMSFSLPLGCYDQVTYNKSLLLNQNLQTGGSSALRNGATVNFDPAGNDTYDNNGCQAPITPIGISANNVSSLTICPGDSINLTSTITGAIQAIIWEGASGSFSNPNNATTTYYSSFNDITPYHIIIGGIDACNDTIYDSLLVNLNPPSNVSILEPDTTTICQGDSVMLHATGSSPFLWSTGETTDSILVNSAGNYTVSASGNCPSNIDTATIVNPPILNVTMNQPDTTTICQGSSITLTASGSPSYLWSTGATTSSITVNATGLITVTSNENCPSNTDSLQVLISTPPLLNITEPDVVELCQGQTTTLNVTNSDPFTWNTGATTNSITVNTADTFFVTSTNNCFTVFDTVIVTLTPQINVTITEPDAVICAGEILTLNANGANAYNWSNGITDSITMNLVSGNYQLTVTDLKGCTDTASIFINQPLAVSIPSIDVTDAFCYGDSNGVLTVNVAGGTPPFDYSIDGMNYQSSNALGNLSANSPITTRLFSLTALATVTTSPNNVPSIGLTASPKTSKPTLTLPIEAGAKTET